MRLLCERRLKPDKSAKILRFLFIVIAAAIIAVAAAGCSLVPEREAAIPELIENVRVKVDSLPVKRGTLSVELNGVATVVPSHTDYQFFRIDGTLSAAAVNRGDYVKKGDVLLRLDSGSFELQVIQQKLAIENMQSVLLQTLIAGNIDEIRIEQMNLEIEKLKLDQLLEREGKRVLVAPRDGIVTFLDGVRVGSPISAYRAVVGIASTDQLQLHYVGDLSAYLNDIKVGMPVILQYQGAPVKATVAVTPLTAQLDENPQRAEINAKKLIFDLVDEIPSGLTSGANMEFKLVLNRKTDSLIIPRGALRSYQGRQYVQIVNGETRREVDVQVGLVNQTEVEIVSGLTEGQQVVVNQ